MNADLADHVVAVHVGSPKLNLEDNWFPVGNWIGTQLLSRVLQLALLRDKAEDVPAVYADGPLNDSRYLVVVVDRNAAVETITRELKSIGLLGFSHIGVADDGVFRCVYPSTEVSMEWLLDSERQELFAERRDQATIEFLRKL